MSENQQRDVVAAVVLQHYIRYRKHSNFLAGFALGRKNMHASALLCHSPARRKDGHSQHPAGLSDPDR